MTGGDNKAEYGGKRRCGLDETDMRNWALPGPWLIVLRLFAATHDMRVADDLAGVVASKASRFGAVQTRPVERYWKIPEYYEVGIFLHPNGEALAAFEGMLAELATGWNRAWPEDPWPTWKPSAEGRCFSPLVTWMSLHMVLDE